MTLRRMLRTSARSLCFEHFDSLAPCIDHDSFCLEWTISIRDRSGTRERLALYQSEYLCHEQRPLLCGSPIWDHATHSLSRLHLICSSSRSPSCQQAIGLILDMSVRRHRTRVFFGLPIVHSFLRHYFLRRVESRLLKWQRRQAGESAASCPAARKRAHSPGGRWASTKNFMPAPSAGS